MAIIPKPTVGNSFTVIPSDSLCIVISGLASTACVRLFTSVTTLQIGSYSGLDSSPYGILSGNHIEDRPVYLVNYR